MQRKYEQWEHTRLLAAFVINTVAKKPVKPTDVLKLPTDKKGAIMSEEDIKKLFERGKLKAKILNLKAHGNSRDKRKTTS